MDYDIDKLVGEMDFSKNMLNHIGNNIYLSNYEKDFLNKYNINYKNCTDLKSILFFIEEILNEDSTLDDLETISKSISERDYYLNTNK